MTQQWKAIVRSSIGVSHQRSSLPCQDYGGYRCLENHDKPIAIGVVADGAGSARFSEIGAQLTVETALAELAEFPQFQTDWETRKQENFADLTNGEVNQKLFAELQQAIVSKLKEKAKELDCDLQDLACTLIVFIATSTWLLSAQIGDGFIVVRGQGDEAYQVLSQPQKGEYWNETTFVTSATALEALQIHWFGQAPQFIAVSTDGLEEVALNLGSWTAHGPFFQPFDEFMKTTADPEAQGTDLEDFLNSDRLNERTDDDKTLLLCYLSGAEPSCP